MSDRQDMELGEFAEQLTDTYRDLVTTCLNLPVPITLHAGVVRPAEAYPAVTRVIDLIEDQPLPEEQQMNLQVACCMWMAALDLYKLQAGEARKYRLEGAAMALAQADIALADLGSWLLEQQEQQD
ncbi:hypothetical protein [Streptomyces halobius]|uniref:Uncharacterized protein n=1 Tax=Streptomyces halobius TaxID=2879846 RepID=A0ABY4MCZ2_9ACTN|nr:hypothetical protein [Streptomyces halobius]UQA95644.1 hypothetical protein K9S39_30650 [Streptomyces halobius]